MTDVAAALRRRLHHDRALLGGDVTVTRLQVLGRPSVVAVTLASGARFVYRPRDLRIAAWFMELCRELNERGLAVPLHVRPILARPGYGWDAWVEAAPCAGADEVERYFVRVGELARLLSLLRAVDMHRHNVIAAGEHPVLVDLEGLFRPARPERTLLERTPYGTGFLPIWLCRAPGQPAVNAGGIPAAPGHRDAVLRGYDEMQAALGRIDLAAWLRRAAGLPVRRFPPAGAPRTLVVGPADVRPVRLDADAALDRDVIACALALAPAEPVAPAAAAAPRELDWIAAARAVADRVLAAGLDCGAVWVPWAGVRRLAPLPADVLSGHAGAAIVLARLFVATGVARYRDAAVHALAVVARAVHAGGRWLGAYLGLGGQLHALQVCGRLLGLRAATELAARRIAALRREPPAAASDDLVGGVAGLAVACPEAWLGDLLLERRRAGLRPPPFLGTGGLPPGLPGLEDGVALALARIAARTGDPRHGAPAPVAAPADLGHRARAIAGRHAATGTWGTTVPDRLDPSAVTGLLGTAHLFLQVGAGAPGLLDE